MSPRKRSKPRAPGVAFALCGRAKAQSAPGKAARAGEGMGVGEKGVTEHPKLHKKVGIDHCFPPDRHRLSPWNEWLGGFFNQRSKNPSNSAGIQAQVAWLLLYHQVTRAPLTT